MKSHILNGWNFFLIFVFDLIKQIVGTYSFLVYPSFTQNRVFGVPRAFHLCTVFMDHSVGGNPKTTVRASIPT
jgi:hypothetical protein